MTKDTDFKFSNHAPGENPGMIPAKNSGKGGVARVT